MVYACKSRAVSMGMCLASQIGLEVTCCERRGGDREHASPLRSMTITPTEFDNDPRDHSSGTGGKAFRV